MLNHRGEVNSWGPPPCKSKGVTGAYLDNNCKDAAALLDVAPRLQVVKKRLMCWFNSKMFPRRVKVESELATYMWSVRCIREEEHHNHVCTRRMFA